MEQDSTQAVKADTTAQEPAVKRLRRGEVREDGKIFWCYGEKYRGGEYWLDASEYAEKKAKQADRKRRMLQGREAGETRLRCGDTREDGMVFWAYGSSYANGEHWVSPARFEAKKTKQSMVRAEKEREMRATKTTISEPRKRGDVRDDGMVFWAYASPCSGGEWWVSPDKYAGKKSKDNARARERRATDPLFALKCRLRDRVYRALKTKGLKKNTKTAAMLGCTYEEFKAHIESKFLPGMSWANFSDCHIDHIVPLDAAVTEEDVYSLSHYTNLRPLWGPDNLAKNAALPKEHELPDNLHPKVKEIWLTAQAR